MEKVMLNARLTPEEYAEIEKRARDLGVSITGLIRMLASAVITVKVDMDKEDATPKVC